MAARRRFREGDTGGWCSSLLRLTVLRLLRQWHHDRRAGLNEGSFISSCDIEAARAELIGRGVEVSEAFHFGATFGRGTPAPAGPRPGTVIPILVRIVPRSGRQQLAAPGDQERFPGRGFSNLDLATLTHFLKRQRSTMGCTKQPPRSTTGRVVRRLHRRAPARAGRPRRPSRCRALCGACASVRMEWSRACDAGPGPSSSARND